MKKNIWRKIILSTLLVTAQEISFAENIQTIDSSNSKFLQKELVKKELSEEERELLKELIQEGATTQKELLQIKPDKVDKNNTKLLVNKNKFIKIEEFNNKHYQGYVLNNLGLIKTKTISQTEQGWLITLTLGEERKLRDSTFIDKNDLSKVDINISEKLITININFMDKDDIVKPNLDILKNKIKISLPINKNKGIFGIKFPSFFLQKNNIKKELKPRAIAPPLGDIAVGSIVLKNRGFIELEGPRVTLKLQNSPALSSLMELAELGNYGFVYVQENKINNSNRKNNQSSINDDNIPKITLNFKNENYAKAINSILLASGLQGKKDGNLLIVGKNVLGKSFGPQLSKVYRLNQASSESAADYLASLGAQINKVNIISASMPSSGTGGMAGAGVTQSITSIDTYSASTGPLKGLIGTTDSRLQTITLIGSANLISVAEKYLKQLDLRQRQVALSVKILDVDLSNTDDIQNDLAIRMGSTFIVSNNGELRSVFGAYLPSDGSSQPLETQLSTSSNQSTKTGNSSKDSTENMQTDSSILKDENSESDNFTNTLNSSSSKVDSNDSLNALTTGASKENRSENNNQSINQTIKELEDRNANQIDSTTNSSQNKTVTPNPGYKYPDKELYTYLVAKIRSSSTKVLANPTLILSENPEEIRGGAQTTASGDLAAGGATIGRPYANESFISVGKQVITDFKITQNSENGPVGCEPSFETSGITFGARVNKIDDNGFVTFSLSPKLTAVTEKFLVPNCGAINILNVRRLDTGTLRVKDSQTLILTGVISDFDSEVVNKWPILGDMPIVGRLFRSTSGEKRKSELVIMVTPRIIDDTNSGVYGYGYNPSSKVTKDILNQNLNN